MGGCRAAFGGQLNIDRETPRGGRVPTHKAPEWGFVIGGIMEMTVFRVHKNDNYTVLSNYHFKEKGMSLKAKGLLSLMLSLPENWDYSAAGLVTLSKDGKDSVNAALKELEKFGYLKRTQAFDESGKFSGYNYEIFEQPNEAARVDAQKAESPKTKKPFAENPSTGKPTTENPQQLNIKELNTKKSNTKKEKDKLDKIDKSDAALCEPNSLTKKLIEIDYIKSDDICIDQYNNIFDNLIDDFGFEIVRSCLWYFMKRYKWQPHDEDGFKIVNKLAYFEEAITSGAARLERDNDYRSSPKTVGSWFYN